MFQSVTTGRVDYWIFVLSQYYFPLQVGSKAFMCIYFCILNNILTLHYVNASFPNRSFPNTYHQEEVQLNHWIIMIV